MKKIYLFFTAFIVSNLLSHAQVMPGVCMVTVDDSSKHNIIYYDKTQFSVADSFILWRETNTAGVYARVMANHKLDTSRFIDMDTAANPNIKLHRYKMQIWDQVGGYSQLGPYHTTLYCLQNISNYGWNFYDIEGSGSGMVNEYKLLRDDNSLNQWHAIDSVSGSTNATTDPNALAFPNADWRLITKWSLSCTTTGKYGNNETQATIVKSKSNITNNKMSGINTLNVSWLNLFPNPTTNKVVLRLNFPLAQNSMLKIYNMLGGEVMQVVLPAGKDELEINVSGLPGGMYVAELNNSFMKVNKRLAIE